MDMISGSRNLRQINWPTVVLFVLGFWLSSSLLLDTVIIPSLLAGGMMTSAAFPSAAYLLFGVFNKIELLCSALVLTSVLVVCRNHFPNYAQERWSLLLAGLLLAIALVDTYVLVPQMSGMGLHLHWFEAIGEMPSMMMVMHSVYWFLEVSKLVAGATLLRWCYRHSCSLI